MDTQIRKEAKALINRLRSIKDDSDFVTQIADRFPSLKLIPNERCGLWYIPPKRRQHHQTVYFKSTDGHFGIWNLSLKRLNLHILPLIANDCGCIIVDSTRSGKRFPDSLSKTIPIWCCVINNAIALHRIKTQNYDASCWDTEFHSLPTLLSPSEHQQIASKIEWLVSSFLSCPSVSISHLSSILKKPLRPIWIAPDTHYFANIIESAEASSKKERPDPQAFDFYPVICVNASEVVRDASQWRKGFYYLQGAADDHEMWARGLTPELFWQNASHLLKSGNTDLDCVKLCDEIVTRAKAVDTHRALFSEDDAFNWIGETGIAIGGRRSGKPPDCWKTFDVVINCGALEYPDMIHSLLEGKRYLFLRIPEGKKGQHALYESIPIATKFVIQAGIELEKPKILIHCAQARDRSVAIVMCLFLQFLNSRREIDFMNPRSKELLDKKVIQDLLIYIQEYRHIARPSRVFLCRIHDYFLSQSFI